MALTWNSVTFNGRERASYRFSDEQRSAARLVVDVEILTTTAKSYENFKYPNPRSFYGYAQRFFGASVYQEIPLSYGLNRVLDVENIPAIISLLNRQQNLWTNQRDIAQWSALNILQSQPPGPPETFEVWAIRDTVLKVACDYKNSFNFIVSWVPLTGLEQYGEILPQDESDPSDDKDEYDKPDQRDPDNPWADTPIPGAPQPGSDPDDFPAGLPAWPMGPGVPPATLSYEVRTRTSTNCQWRPGQVGVYVPFYFVAGFDPSYSYSLKVVWDGGEVILTRRPDGIDYRNWKLTYPGGATYPVEGPVGRPTGCLG